MKHSVLDICSVFDNNANVSIAQGQKQYLKNQFDFFGIQAPLRRKLQRPFLLKANIPPKHELDDIVRELWSKPERECHYFAQELVEKYSSQFEKDDILILEYMITHQSWWDTVDFIAAKLVGPYFKSYPDSRLPITNKWLGSENIWLQRSCVLFQLHYKQDVDTDLLRYIIEKLLGSNEFFINKAIGWILRQYSKTNPEWVINFVRRTDLAALSKREALKYILK